MQGLNSITKLCLARSVAVQTVSQYLDKEKALLAIPESCADKIISLYHNSLFAGHQGVIKTYLTMTSKFLHPKI